MQLPAVRAWRRGAKLAVACGLTTLGMVGPWAAAASADAPEQQGWWTLANPGSAFSLPAPPDVPANGLLVEGSAGSKAGSSDGGPFAFAALVYPLQAGSSPDSLTVAAAANSGTTPTASLELCPLTSSAWAPEQGGPMSDAPGFSCRSDVTAAPSGGTYRFKVASLVRNGELAVALLPTNPADRVVLAHPGANSLTLSQGSGSAAATPTSPPPSAPPGGQGFGGGSAAATPSPAAPVSAGMGGGGGSVVAGGPRASDGSGPAVSPGRAPDVATPPSAAGATTSGSGGRPPAQQTATPAGAANASFDGGRRPAGGFPWVAILAVVAVVAAGVSWMAAGRSAEQAALEDGMASDTA